MKTTKKKSPETRVIVRTYSAGVYTGVLLDKSEDGRRVRLGDARILWSWEGALTTLDLAAIGPSAGKISHPVTECEVTEAIAVIAMTDAAVKRIEEIKPWAPRK